MKEMNETYGELAHAVVCRILKETGAEMPVFEQQYACSEIVETTVCERGFYMTFRVKEGCPVAVGNGTKTFGTVEAQLPELSRGMGFILWVKDGLIHSLEGYTYEEKLPERAEGYRLSGGATP